MYTILYLARASSQGILQNSLQSGDRIIQLASDSDYIYPNICIWLALDIQFASDSDFSVSSVLGNKRFLGLALPAVRLLHGHG